MELDHQTKQTLAEVSALLVAHPIETPRLLLRPFREGDLADLYEYLSQKEQRRLSGNVPVESLEDARQVLAWFMHPASPAIYFAVVLKGENKVIGNFTVNPCPYQDRDERLRGLCGVTLSYILNEKYWRQGIMTELLRAVYPFLFEQAGLDYIQSGYFDFNEASAALQRKLGMRLWTEDEFEYEGQRIRTKEMILFREEYQNTGEHRGRFSVFF